MGNNLAQTEPHNTISICPVYVEFMHAHAHAHDRGKGKGRGVGIKGIEGASGTVHLSSVCLNVLTLSKELPFKHFKNHKVISNLHETHTNLHDYNFTLSFK